MQRPVIAGQQSYPKVAETLRAARPGKVPPANRVLRSSPKVAQAKCRKVGPMLPRGPNFGQSRPTSAKIGPRFGYLGGVWSNLAKCWPMLAGNCATSAKISPVRPNLGPIQGQVWPLIANFDRALVKSRLLGQLWQIRHEFDRKRDNVSEKMFQSCRKVGSGAEVRPNFDEGAQFGPDLGYTWPTLTKLWPTST